MRLFVAVLNDMLQGDSVLQDIMTCYKVALCCIMYDMLQGGGSLLQYIMTYYKVPLCFIIEYHVTR